MANKQIPQEVFERFAALYWGQKVYSYKVADARITVGKMFFQNGDLAKDDYLRLRSLADITDDDAIECFNIMFPSSQINHTDESKIDLGKSWVETIDCDGYKPKCWLNMIDFLRSRSYLLPFSGYSAQEWIDSGRVKIKTINP